jgi:phage-related protein
MANFPSDPKPSYPIEETLTEPEVLVSVHKDGSEQRRLKGAGRRRTFRVPFGTSCPITNTQRMNIVDHFMANRTLTAFNWVHPERAETILVRYAQTPTFSHVAYNAYEGEVQLQEVPA